VLRTADQVFRYVVPGIVACLFVGTIVDSLWPWPPAKEALSQYPNQTPVLVGFRFSLAGDHWSRSGTYVLLPSLFSEPRAITIRHSSSSSPPTVTATSEGVVVGMMFTLLCVFTSGWLWSRRMKQPPNSTVERDARNGSARPSP
jgi:hypothetical protein